MDRVRSRPQALTLDETQQCCPSIGKQCLLGLGSALLNPKNALFYPALMTALLGPDVTLLQQSASGVWMVMVVLLWDLTVVSLIGLPAVQNRLRRSVYWIERTAGVVLMGVWWLDHLGCVTQTAYDLTLCINLSLGYML